MRKVIFINPNFTYGVMDVESDELPLEFLQNLVGGRIEVVPTVLSPGWCREHGGKPVMIVNEEGKLKHLDYNEDATFLASASATDLIVGVAVLVMAEGENLMGFLPEAADNIIKQWLD